MKSSIPPSRPLVAVIRGMLQNKTIRYLIVGGSVYVFELWVIIIAQQRGASSTEAVALSFTLGLIVSFFMQKLFTFADKRMHHNIVLRQAIAVGLLVVWNLCFTVLLTKMLQSVLPPTVTRTIALLITTIWNFYLYKTRIFTVPPPTRVPTEHPSILLGFDRVQIPVALPPTETASDAREERQHSLRLVLLSSLMLLALISGSWVASTLQRVIVHGDDMRRNAPTYVGPRPAPLRVDGLSAPSCKGRVVLQVVAHADDDLAFINPDIETALAAKRCVRTVYLTAADHGWGLQYTEEREAGIRAAYSTMLHTDPAGWQPGMATLSGGEQVLLYNSPDTAPLAAVIFLRLPDGDLSGNGFATTGYLSLKKMLADPKLAVTTLDTKTTYTRQSLIKVLAELIAVYQPVEIRTLGDADVDIVGDHSDHVATGELTTLALKHYRRTYRDTTVIPLIKYIGYPIAGRQSNLPNTAADRKAAVFFTYAQYDYNVCKTVEECQSSGSSYAKYVSRRYKLPQNK